MNKDVQLEMLSLDRQFSFAFWRLKRLHHLPSVVCRPGRFHIEHHLSMLHHRNFRYCLWSNSNLLADLRQYLRTLHRSKHFLKHFWWFDFYCCNHVHAFGQLILMRAHEPWSPYLWCVQPFTCGCIYNAFRIHRTQQRPIPLSYHSI